MNSCQAQAWKCLDGFNFFTSFSKQIKQILQYSSSSLHIRYSAWNQRSPTQCSGYVIFLLFPTSPTVSRPLPCMDPCEGLGIRGRSRSWITQLTDQRSLSSDKDAVTLNTLFLTDTISLKDLLFLLTDKHVLSTICWIIFTWALYFWSCHCVIHQIILKNLTQKVVSVSSSSIWTFFYMTPFHKWDTILLCKLCSLEW